ncbi:MULTISPECIES: hypothetical protein [unclassified Pantoea]|uniref:hypothetical protein n=1 Tax=unclassified Pantoea TaxID=2630326 RepID=UPI001CD2E1C6|nr:MULTISPECIES: hypothetical protein [unclassified Pantoea]MCA1174874.1 hypothetical protein [Pantoea sp. alder69]MCA1249836.1 hypothetical protein [Pantoea sp. alder70]MCA1264209.1 hypothetical protein [Pantoea sp. alder81]
MALAYESWRFATFPLLPARESRWQAGKDDREKAHRTERQQSCERYRNSINHLADLE